MLRLPWCGRFVPAVVAGLLVVLASWPASGDGASSGTVVGAVVPSATQIDATACAPNLAGVTNLGIVIPGTSVTSTADCHITFGSSNDTAMLRMYQQDLDGNALTMPVDGRLAPSFNGTGKVVTSIAAVGSEQFRAVAVQADGKIVAAGYTESGGTDDFLVVRYNQNGTLDTTFDGDGIAVTPVLAADDQAYGVVIQPDGKIVVAGSAMNGSYRDYAVVRYTTTGSLDTSFDGDGKWTSGVLGDDEYLAAVTLQSDGRIVAVGTMAGGRGVVIRLLADGAFDTSFDGDGAASVPAWWTVSGLRAVMIQPDGRIVAGGTRMVGGYGEMIVTRLTSAGAADTTFDADGTQNWDIGTDHDIVYTLALGDSGRIIAGGVSHPASIQSETIMVLNSSGGFDPSFDGDGKLIIPAAANRYLASILVQPDGRILGASSVAPVVHMFRLKPDGSNDPSFDGDGEMTLTFNASGQAGDIAPLSDGRVVVVGTASGFNDVGAAVLDATPFDDYTPGVTDWSTGSSTFGACLRTIGGANTFGAWSVDAGADCGATNADSWYDVADAPSSPTAKVAYTGTTGATDGSVDLRFGARAASSQRPGDYIAPLTFEVVAPNA